MDLAIEINGRLRNVPDFPKPGILFKDITPLLQDAELLSKTVLAMSEWAAEQGATHIGGIESRGFLWGVLVAQELGLPFIALRKQGKLPWKTYSAAYDLEYGEAVLEMHQDAVDASAKVVLIDDLLATGGTMEAAISLIQKGGAEVVGCSFVVSLDFLNGAERLKGVPIQALVHC